MSIKVELEGMDRVIKKFNKLAHEDMLKALEAPATELSNETMQRMKQRAPVRTGFLRSDIRVIQKAVGKKGMLIRVGTRGGRSAGEKEARHATLLEYGTVKMAARPFMRPALDSMRQRAIDSIRRAVKEAVEK